MKSPYPPPVRGEEAAKPFIEIIDILNLAVLYFGLIFIGFACGKAKALPEAGLACCVVTLTSMMWMLQTG